MRRLIQTTSKLSVIALAVTSLLPLHGDAMAKVGAAQESLELGFDDPAMEYGPRTWWHWINERVSKDGITKDLEAMKEIGYKGVHMVNLPQGGAAWTVGDDVVGDLEWSSALVAARAGSQVVHGFHRSNPCKIFIGATNM
jgi:hypothetical protein